MAPCRVLQFIDKRSRDGGFDTRPADRKGQSPCLGSHKYLSDQSGKDCIVLITDATNSNNKGNKNDHQKQ